VSLSHFTELSLFPIAPLSRKLTVETPQRDEVASRWLRNKSQVELWALVQHGNPQEIIPYSIALTSQLNQVTSFLLYQYECASVGRVELIICDGEMKIHP